MHTDLYLDTARLGRMCPTAVRAEQDFAKLVSQLGSSLYLERFLVEGFCSLPDAYQADFPWLECWNGLTELQRDFARFVSAPDCCVSFFSQSRTLMDAAVRCLLKRTQHVLTTDLAWPPYLRALTTLAHDEGKSVTVSRLRDDLFRDRLSDKEVIGRLQHDYSQHGCDGLFLSSTSYLGFTLPIRQLLHAIPPPKRPKFVLVDAAQSLGQMPVDMLQLGCDMLIGGSQKWLQAGRPLRVAIAKQHFGASNMGQGTVDPLHQFTQRPFANRFGETVDLSTLIAAAASLAELSVPHELEQRWHGRERNREALLQKLHGCGLNPLRHQQSAIVPVMLDQFSRVSRQHLFEHGIVASKFREFVRLSMPTNELCPVDLNRIANALLNFV